MTTLAGSLDAAAIARARTGDREALATVIGRYDHGLRTLAYRLLGDRQSMDDALQETYVKAFRALPDFRGEASLGTWLYRIAYNACLDELARRQREPQVPLDAEPERADPGPALHEGVAARSELARGLAALAPPDRAAVLLVDAQGFDYESAGEVLGVPAGTIASRLNRARAALRAHLEGGRR